MCAGALKTHEDLLTYNSRKHDTSNIFELTSSTTCRCTISRDRLLSQRKQVTCSIPGIGEKKKKGKEGKNTIKKTDLRSK